MKTLAILVLSLLSIAPLFAGYSISIPDSGNDDFIVVKDGEMLPLDENVWMKRWNGLTAEQLDNGIYKVTEESESILISYPGTSREAIEDALRFEYGISTAIIPDSNGLEAGTLAEAGIRLLLTIEPMPQIQERLMEEENIDVQRIQRGSLIDIENGFPIKDSSNRKELIFFCPDCVHEFRITI